MKLVLRRVEPGEFDWEWVMGVLFLPLFFSLVLAATWLPGSLVPVCRTPELFGIPCPTCGCFRAATHIARGQFLAAVCVQPLAVAILFGSVMYAVYAWVVLLFRLPRIRLEGVTGRWRWACILVGIGLVVANWVYLVAVLQPR